MKITIHLIHLTLTPFDRQVVVVERQAAKSLRRVGRMKESALAGPEEGWRQSCIRTIRRFTSRKERLHSVKANGHGNRSVTRAQNQWWC